MNGKCLNCEQTQDCPANDFGNPVQPGFFFQVPKPEGHFVSASFVSSRALINTITMKPGG